MAENRYRPKSAWQHTLVLALAIATALLGWALTSAEASPNDAQPNAPKTSTSTPTETPTYTPTPVITPSGEPELDVLQYVINMNPSWTCQGPYGTPGHRYISDCNPFGFFSHATTGYVDNYGTPGSAQANWQARRANAQGYPIFLDTTAGGYPAYEAGNNNFPYAHYEDYFWGNISVLGAASSDDTSFRGAPPVASAIYQAAVALGYFYITPPSVTPTYTPTHTPTATNTPFPGPVPTCGLNNNYVVLQSTGATIVPGVLKITGQQDDDTVTDITLPFFFYMYGQYFSHVRADSNGNLQFSNSQSTNANQCLPIFNYTNIMMPYWDNLDLRSSANPDLGIFTSLSGLGPDRIFNIEWRACIWNNGTCGGYVNFEVRLHENQNRFDFVYGQMAGGGSGATVGVQSMRGVGQTEYSCNTSSLQPGLQLTFLQQNCSNYEPKLIGHVTWQGRPPQPNTLQQLPITLTVKSSSAELDYPVQNTDASGFFTVSVGSLQVGNYGWRVKGPQFLANAGTMGLGRDMYTSVEMGLMRTGDANNDNTVGAIDFNILRAAFGTSIGDPGYDERADFTGDQIVNALDFNLLRGNYGMGGAPPLAPSAATAPFTI